MIQNHSQTQKEVKAWKHIKLQNKVCKTVKEALKNGVTMIVIMLLVIKNQAIKKDQAIKKFQVTRKPHPVIEKATHKKKTAIAIEKKGICEK